MMYFLKSLRSRLILLIILVALPGLVTLFYVSYLDREHAMYSTEEQAIKAVDVTTEFQTQLLKRTENFLRHLATFNAVLDPDSPDCSAFLADVIKITDLYHNIGVPRVDGELICSAKPLTQRINVADRPYFKHAMTTGEFSIGEFQIDRVTKLTSINFAYPVVDPKNDEIVGIAVAALSLDWWSKQLSEAKLPKNTVAYIFDHQQNIIASFPSDSSLLGTHIDDIHLNLKKFKASLYNIDEAYLSADEHLRVFFQKPLFENSDLITISVGIPFDEQLDIINTRLTISGAILLSVVLLIIFLAIWGINTTLLTPLKQLMQSTKDLELGNDISYFPKHGASELIDLHQRFSAMAKTRLNAEKDLNKSQLSLKESERELSEHIANTPLGCISWDRNLTCTKWNKSAENIFGYSAQEAIGKSAHELIMVPELTTELVSIYQLLLDRKGGSYNTNENVTNNGERIVCDWYNTPILDKHNNVIGVTCLVQDITKSKQLEEQLTLAASVFSHAREGIIITDINGNIIEVNDTFVEITGYPREEVLGRNPSFLKSNQQAPDFYNKLWRSINERGFWIGEIWNKRKNNEIYAQLLTISAVKDAAGKVKNYVAIFTDISELKAQQHQLEHMAHYDVLTNLPNRTLLADRLSHAIAQSKRNNNQLAVIFLDLDGFKEINDTHGHAVGDELLVIIAAQLKDTLRDCDTLSRFGGDEFVAVLANLEHVDDFHPIVERMLTAASLPVTLGSSVLKVTASIGVTLYPSDHTDADQLIRHADQAMYVAKQKGKNCYHLFDIQSDDAIKVRHEILQNINNALLNKEFVLFYQPKVNMKTGAIIGAEALIRWQHPTRGLLSPAEFLPFIENHQLSIDIGEWVIEEALKQIAKWKKVGLNIPISVNVGALQIQQKNFPTRLEMLLKATPEVMPNNLQLEVLETSEIGNLIDVSQIMNSCIALGVGFAIDDFGTGYSSLTYLRRLPANLIKIDQTFVRDMLLDSEDRAIVIGIVALAKSFNRQVIAEGVETIEHGKSLLNLGCELAQGYGIARPMPANEIPLWAKNWKDDKWQVWNQE